MPKISALIITYNEENNIQRFLEDASYADEIILVDSFSSDQTIEIAKRFEKVKIFQREFKNFTDQKNFAIDQASNDWVTFFDADEHIPLVLREEFLNELEKNDASDAYFVHRKFFFKNKLIRFSGMQSDKQIRVFKKSKARYKANLLVHEVIECEGTIGNLKNSLDHYSFSSVEDFRNKLMHYSRLRAKELERKKLKPNFFHFYFKPMYRFFNHYVMRLGFLDGKEGYIISKLHAESVRKRYVFLNEIYEARASAV